MSGDRRASTLARNLGTGASAMHIFIYITSIFGAIAVYQVLGWTLNRKLYFFPGLQEKRTSDWAVETTEIYCFTVLEVRNYDQGVSRLN